MQHDLLRSWETVLGTPGDPDKYRTRKLAL